MINSVAQATESTVLCYGSPQKMNTEMWLSSTWSKMAHSHVCIPASGKEKEKGKGRQTSSLTSSHIPLVTQPDHTATFTAREAEKWSLYSGQPCNQVKILLLKRNETMNKMK